MSLKFFEIRNKIIDLLNEAEVALDDEMRSFLFDYVRAESAERYWELQSKLEPEEIKVPSPEAVCVLKDKGEFNCIQTGLKLSIQNFVAAMQRDKEQEMKFR